ncbi:MAG: PA14 domain-containing protein [Caldilineaceae bacterium]
MYRRSVKFCKGESYRIVGEDAAGQWWLLCCFDGETAWVQQSLVAVEGTTASVPVVTTSGVTSGTTAGTPLITTPVTVPVITAATTAVTAPVVIPTTVPTPVLPAAAAPIVVTPVAPSTTVTPVGAPPVGTPPTPAATVTTPPLWQATYFAGTALAGQPVATELVTAVAFVWGSNAPVPQLPVDSFSARFEQTVPLVAGFYTLRAQADDGVRVYINDELVIDEWHTGEPPAYTAGRQLSGLTTFRVEYYESGGQAGLQFDYTLADTFPDWRAEYYDNITLAGDPVWIQPEPLSADVALSQQWSLSSPVPDVLPDNNWSARWTGTFSFVGGNYIFRAEANDGVRVWIDGIQVIDQWQDGSNTAETVFEDIGAGNHAITVEYYERGGIANLKVDWARIVQPD